MNVADSEVVASIMETVGYEMAATPEEADAVLLNTCSIRDNAEQKIVSRLAYLASLRRKRSKDLPKLIIGVIGCMGERVKEELISWPDLTLTLTFQTFSLQSKPEKKQST